MKWNLQSDEVVISFEKLMKEAFELKPTKRNILRICAGFYDPLGLITPITIQTMVLFQLICKSGTEWVLLLQIRSQLNGIIIYVN